MRYWPGIWPGGGCVCEGRLKLFCSSRMSSLSLGEVRGKVRLECEGALRVSGERLPPLFKLPWNRICGQALKERLPGHFTAGFRMVLSVAGDVDFRPRHSAHQQMGFIWSPLVPPSRESWEATPWWLVSKTLDRVEVLLHKPPTWRTRLKCSAAGSYRFLEAGGAFWILGLIGCLKRNWPQVGWWMRPLRFLQMDWVVVGFSAWSRGGRRVFHGLRWACRYLVWPACYFRKYLD